MTVPVKFTDLLAIPAFSNQMETISGGTFEPSYVDHQQTRLVNQVDDMTMVLRVNLPNGLEWSVLRKPTSSGQFGWSNPDGATIQTIPDGAQSLDVGYLYAQVENPSGTAATIILSGSLI